MNIIRTLILCFYLCTLYVRVDFAEIEEESTTAERNKNKFTERPKVFRKKGSSKNSVKRRQTFLRESDKFFKNKMHLNQTSNEDEDTILQANFGVSKPKPWRKDDEVSIRNNARAEIVVNPDKIETEPKGKGTKQEPQKDSYFKRRKKFQIGRRISDLFSGDKEEMKLSMPNCGESSLTNKRIVNGKNAQHGAYPWIVVVLKQGDAWCAGSIIKEEWILTAAHCFMGDRTPQIYAIRVGTVNRNEGETYKVAKVIIHERFHLDNMFNSDVALVKTVKKIKMSKLVTGVCLPTKPYEEPQSNNVVVAGWGQTSFENKELPVFLQEIVLNRVTINDCAKRYKIKGNSLYWSQICTWNPNQDACQGDSGAPAIEWRNRKAYQVGIVSYGSTCADELPGVYTKVSYYIKWIAKTIELN